MVKPLPRPVSGYVLPDGSLEPSLPEYLVAWVRERYARDAIAPEQLERCVEAALRGNYAVAIDSPFPPAKLTFHHW